MAQFVVYRNANPATRQATPLLLEVQHDLLASLATTVVVPLRPVAAMKGATLRTLTPVVEVEGREYVLVTPELAGVPRKALGPAVTSIEAQRGAVMAALDLLVSGI
jgi:toxin CcdB